jgi:hypothetical protein
MWLRWWKKSAEDKKKTSRRRDARRRAMARPPLGLEPLEDRTMPSAFSTLATDLSNQLNAIDQTVDSAFDKAAMVPFLNGNTGLLDAKTFVDGFNSKLQMTLSGFSDPSAGTDDQTLATDVQMQLFKVLGNKGGLNVLGDKNNDGTVDYKDINVTISGDSSSNAKIAVDMRLHQDILSVSTPTLKFGLGLPALPFQAAASGGVQLKVGFDFELGFAYDATNQQTPFSFEPTGTSLHIPKAPNAPYDLSGTTPANSHLLAVEAEASLVNFSAGINVGFFNGTAKDNGNTGLHAAFVLDNLADPNNLKASVLGAADVNLGLTLGVTDGNGGLNTDFPSASTNFVLNWDFNDNSSPTAAFDDVSVSVGALFSDIVHQTHLLDYVQDFTKPLQPLFDVLKARLPVLSDVAGKNVSLESIADFAAQNGAFGQYSALVQLATNLVDVADFVNKIDDSNTNGNQVMIDFGNFSLGGANEDLRAGGGLPAAPADIAAALTADPNAVITSWAPNPNDFQVADLQAQLDKVANDPNASSLARDAAKAAEQLLPKNVASVNLSFPFFDDPANGLFKLLLGQDADLVSFSARFNVAAQENSNQLFGLSQLPGLTFNFVNQVNIDAYFKAAYDTFGLRQFVHDALMKNINPGDLANGFYLATDTSNDPNHPNGCHLNLSGEVKVGPTLNLVVFQAGIDGGISADLHLWATAPGMAPKYRLGDLQNADSLFNANGSVDAGLTAFIKVGVTLPIDNFVGWEKDFDIASVKLIDFGTGSVTGNPYNPPADLALATPDPNDPTRLLLNLGQRAVDLTKNQALAGQKDMSFTVSHVKDNPNGGEILQVSAFGFQQQFGQPQGIKTIVVRGANGNDDITIDQGVLADADITEGNGNDQVQFLGSGNAHVSAGNGNDLLQGGTGFNYFRTGSGSSSLLGGDGSSATGTPFWGVAPSPGGQAIAGNGAVFVNDFETGAGAGDNILQGGMTLPKQKVVNAALNHLVADGSGANKLYAGNQDDYLQAGHGTDTLTAGAGRDTIFLPGGTNSVFWQVGDGNLTVSTGVVGVGFSTNALEVRGSDQNDVFTLSRNPNDPMGVQVQANAAQITWAGFVQKVSIDGGKGDDTTTVNDLSGSTVQDVGLNDGAALKPDGGQDVVNVEGSPTSHTITVATESAFLHPPSEGQLGGVMLVQTTPQYKVHVAITNHADTLNVFAKGSGNTINVQSNTGHTVINTDAGGDTFNVSSDAPADDGVLLDHPQNRPPFGLFGQLDLHAGPASNILNVSESGSTQKDHVTISDGSIVGGVLTSQDPTNNDRKVSLTYHINYDAVGSFAGGIHFKASKAADIIDVVSLPEFAPTTITTDGAAQVVVGSDPTHPALSTLDTVRSSVLVVDNAGHKATVLLNDRGTARPDTYAVSTVNLPPVIGEVSRFTRPADSVFFEDVASVALNTADNENNQVVVLGTPLDTAVHVHLGPGVNHVGVDSKNLTLSSILGPLFVDGQSGKDRLLLDDQNGAPTNTYTIDKSSISSSQSAAIHFHKMGRVTLIGGTSIETYKVEGVPADPLVIHAQGPANLLIGPNRVNQWSVTAADAGTLDASVTFTGIQSLTGGSVKDTFTFEPAGSLSGSINGQAPASLATIAGFKQTNVTVQANVALQAGQSVTLLARYDAASDSYYGAELVWTGVGFEPVIYRMIQGVKTVLKAGPLIPSATGTLAFKVNGAALDLYLNNALLVSAADSTLGAGGAGVLFGPGVSVSDFSAA